MHKHPSGGKKEDKLQIMKKLIINKKGSSTAVAIWVILVVIILIASIGGYAIIKYNARQTALDQQKQAEAEGKEPVSLADLRCGEISNLKLYVQDQENNDPTTKVASEIYCIDKDGKKVIDGTNSSTTAETTGSTSKCNTIKCISFSKEAYYGEWKTINTDFQETLHEIIPVSTVAKGGLLELYTTTLTTGQVNITGVGANAEKTLDHLKYTNNDSDSAMNLAGFFFDIGYGGNVSKIEVKSGDSTITDTGLKFEVTADKEKDDFVSEIDDDSATPGNQPIILHEYDEFESGKIIIGANSNGCASGGEGITVYAFDKANFKARDGTIQFGHQTDTDTVADVGASHVNLTVQMLCKG